MLITTATAVPRGFSACVTLALALAPVGPALCAELPGSCVTVLTGGVLINTAAGPLPAGGSHVPQAARSSARFLLVALGHALNTLLKPVVNSHLR